MDYMENLKRPEVLIIDDDPEHAQFITSILKRRKYSLCTVNDGREVFETLQSGIPDLILLDIVMPQISGYEVCRRLKQDKDYCSIPVIFITALDDTASIVKGFKMGAQDYVSKPVNPEVLLARVETQIELKRSTDKMKSAYEEIENFNHIISHDLKAPLWDIRKLVECLEQAVTSNDNGEVGELLEYLDEKAGEAAMLVDKLSELTKMSSVQLKIEAVDMNKLVDEAYQELISGMHGRQIEFNCACLPIVFGDRLLLKQVLVNILSNALKYTRDRVPAIINMEYYKSGMEYVFSLKDNGVGFDMKYSGKLFQMFQRMHTQQEFEGTGAGLTIVKRIIKRHNGRVWIEAELNKGAALSFTLPIRVN